MNKKEFETVTAGLTTTDDYLLFAYHSQNKLKEEQIQFCLEKQETVRDCLWFARHLQDNLTTKQKQFIKNKIKELDSNLNNE